MGVQTVLDLSTAHLSALAREELDQEGSPASWRNEWGFIVPVLPGSMEDDYKRKLSIITHKQLREVMSYAIQLGVHYVKFDADADRCPGLPVYPEDE